MTTEEAIKSIRLEGVEIGGNIKRVSEFLEAMDVAISRLRAQQEQERNAPLTIEELRQMNVEPVYIVSGDVSWWDIVDHSSNYMILRSGEALPYKRCGEWLAYRHKPEEG